MIDLGGKTALITGGSRGLGRATANAMAGAGARVCIVDLPQALETAGLPEDWQTVPLDLTAPEAEQELAAAIEALGKLDILVANAGIVPPWRRIAALDFEEWDAAFALNVRGVALCLKAAAPHLARTKGSAVLMSSINGYTAHPDQTLYTATKHAVLGIARAAALDLGRDGVRVNALAPGPILTDALRGRIETRAAAGGMPVDEAIGALSAQTALGRLATEADVASAACFLASPLAAGITGVLLPVEAGLA
ncbi:SDR family NAD(P)-dependent oxidoreductase [Histidinibacterium aquaticum]|uniref:SDR family oxidoreductase n=1 Tax=Histidinibacterium aquaticum TaxID=2613962 RepID=A0A5J5GKH8_9RHOB|nr:SDR family oxidoreductase [Histidinibacterium aquaticum]KAA9008826.1 SDR family oxidoreductase [Histidinibacterium aquaticum]